MGRILSFAPYTKAGFAEWVHFLLWMVLVYPDFRRHRTARLGWVLSDSAKAGDRAGHVPTVTSLSKAWKTDFIIIIGCVWVRNPILTTKTDLNPGNSRRS